MKRRKFLQTFVDISYKFFLTTLLQIVKLL